MENGGKPLRQLDSQSTHPDSEFAYHTRHSVTPIALHKSKSTMIAATLPKTGADHDQSRSTAALHRTHSQIESSTTSQGTGLGCSAFKMAAFNYKQQIENARAQRVELVSKMRKSSPMYRGANTQLNYAKTP